jgi:hypothetical protein
VVWALALALALAAPGASTVWAAGGHATAEQVALHEHETAHGHDHHHPIHAETSGPMYRCDADAGSRVVTPGSPEVSTPVTSSVAPKDTTQSALPLVAGARPQEGDGRVRAEETHFRPGQRPPPPERPPRLSS